MNTLPKRPLTNVDLLKYTKNLKNFRGIFMRDNLPGKINNIENGIINLDSQDNFGSHWTSYVKKGKNVLYFDSYGNLKPPKEVIKYFNSLGSVKIFYNYSRYQNLNYNCGHLCLQFLYNNV